MKLKSVLLLALSMLAGYTAQAQEIAAKQIINITGVIYITSPNLNTTITERATQKDFIDILAADTGYPLTSKELRSAKLVTFDFGLGLDGLYIEFQNGETRELNYIDVSDRFAFDYLSDVSGNQETNSGRWVAIFAMGIDLIDDDSIQAEFWGVGMFNGAVRLMRRGAANILVFTSGLRSRDFPAVLDVSDDDSEDATPGDLTIAFRTSTVLVDEIIIVNNNDQ